MGSFSRRSRLASGPLLAVVTLALTLPTTAARASDADPIGGPGLAGRGVHVVYGPGAEPLPPIAAASWVIADATTGEILAAKAPHKVRPPASTLKTLTALTLIPQLDAASVYRPVFADVAVEGSRAGIVEGARYTVDDLFYGMLLPSGNDAATALARANGGVKKTVAEMNEVARHLQALDTVARTPHGLDTPGQVSSAYDLALIARAGLQLPAFRTYVSTLQHDFPGRPAKTGKKRSTFELWNQDPLLREGYRGAIGVKTGYTTFAGRTFVGAAQRGDRTLLVTLMGITEPTGSAAAKLLTWGFKAQPDVTPVGRLVDPVEDAPAPVPVDPQPVTAAAPLDDVPVAATSTGASPWPVARWIGAALLVTGAVVGLLSVRGRRRDELSRQRLVAAARRAR